MKHIVYTGEINKIVLCSNDDKRLRTFGIIRTYPYGTNTLKVCKSEMLMTILMKIKQSIIQSDDIFQIVHTEC